MNTLSFRHITDQNDITVFCEAEEAVPNQSQNSLDLLGGLSITKVGNIAIIGIFDTAHTRPVLIGIITYMRRQDGSLYLDYLYIRTAYHRNGVGRAAVDWLKRVHCITSIRTYPASDSSRQFFIKQGFVKNIGEPYGLYIYKLNN